MELGGLIGEPGQQPDIDVGSADEFGPPPRLVEFDPWRPPVGVGRHALDSEVSGSLANSRRCGKSASDKLMYGYSVSRSRAGG